MNYKKTTGFFVVALLLISSKAFANFSYEGFLTATDGVTPITTTVTLTLELLEPGASPSCLLYTETHSVTPNAEGYFSVVVGTGTRTDTLTHSFNQVFENEKLITGVASCSYTPTAGAGRNMRVTVNGDSLGTLALHPSPSSTNADAVGGTAASQLLKVSTGATFATPLTPTQATDLLDLIAGSSLKYLTSNASTAVSLPVYPSTPSSPVAGSLWYDSTTSALKYYNGTASVSLSGGGVSTVAGRSGAVLLTTADLTDFSSATNIEIAAKTNIANGLASLDAGGKVPSSQLSLTPTDIPSLDAGKITTGILMSSQGGTGYGTFANGELLIGNSGGTLTKATLTAGAGVTIVPGSGSISISASGSGGTVTSVSSATTDISVATGTTTPVLSLNVGTAANQIVKLDGTGRLPAVDGSLISNIPTSNITGILPVVSGGTGSSSNFGSNKIVASDVTGTYLTGINCPLNSAISFDVSGNYICADFNNDLQIFRAGGNSFGQEAILGTTDPFPLTLKAGGWSGLTVHPNHNVGIGTTAPAAGLDVRTTFSVGTATPSPSEVINNMKICTGSTAGGQTPSTSNPIAFSLSCPGAAIGSAVNCSPDLDPGSAVSWSAAVFTSGMITVKLTATMTSSSINPLNWKCLIAN